MSIAVGDRLPAGHFHTMTVDGVQKVTTEDVFSGKRIALFAVPAAFTPGCSQIHLPSYAQNVQRIKDKGFDGIACLAVNDAWVMDAWSKSVGQTDEILMLADGNGDYTRHLGLDIDLRAHGMGIRCRRFSMVVEDGVVEALHFDDRAIDKTAAENTCGL